MPRDGIAATVCLLLMSDDLHVVGVVWNPNPVSNASILIKNAEAN